MNREAFTEPQDLTFNLFKLRIGAANRDCSKLHNGCWGPDNTLVTVAKIPKNSFDESNHQSYQDLADSNFEQLVRPIERIEGAEFVYIVFERFKPFLELYNEQHPIYIYEMIFSKLFFNVFMLQKNTAFKNLKLNLKYLSVDQNGEPRILFYPAITTDQTYSERYHFGKSIRFELGCVGHFIQNGILPEDRYGYRYRPWGRNAICTELAFVVDKLLTTSWSRKVCEIFATYINSPSERALFLKRLDRNCYPRRDPKYKDTRWREKEDFLTSLFDPRIFVSSTYSDRWRTSVVLSDWEYLTVSLD
jgi:hypothetical protein